MGDTVLLPSRGPLAFNAVRPTSRGGDRRGSVISGNVTAGFVGDVVHFGTIRVSQPGAGHDAVRRYWVLRAVSWSAKAEWVLSSGPVGGRSTRWRMTMFGSSIGEKAAHVAVARDRPATLLGHVAGACRKRLYRLLT